jgi:ATP-binding cassette subfamily B protein RaxB
MEAGTSHLETDIEARVNAAIRGLGLTRVIIAHRPETIASASRRITVLNGRLQDVAQPGSSSQRCAMSRVTYATVVDIAEAVT